jgi:uncharacterized protein (TIGR03437 family)
MRVRAVLCLALLSATGAMAASSGFLLGADYSEWIPIVTQIATDGSGALYMLSDCVASNCVTELSADGKAILWQTDLGFAAYAMAVDSTGGVYVIPNFQTADTSVYVAKLSADGTGLAWKTAIGSVVPNDTAAIAIDAESRTYLVGECADNSAVACVVRLNAEGSADDYTARVAGYANSIAIDGSGAAFVAGPGFLARLAPDGDAGFYSTTPPALVGWSTVAVDANGNAAVLISALDNGSSVLQRYDSTGAVTSSNTVAGDFPGVALDGAGNAYVVGASYHQLHPVRNSLAQCGTEFLSVYAPDGTLLQTTYIPGAMAHYLGPPVATGPNSMVFVTVSADSTFTPSQAGPLPAVSGVLLWRLSPNPNAETVPLACAGNAASFGEGPLAPGELVTLFGNGLGPEQGVQSQATFESPFPTQAANVEVTFDGTPAPLLWVQDSQINAVAPWSLTPGQDTQICVTYNGAKANCLSWPVAQAAPGVFTVDGVHAAAVNQDGTINSANNPAPPGSIVSVWATGLGPITPPQADGTLVGLPLPINAIEPVEAWSPAPPFEPCHPGVGVVSCQTYTQFAVTYAGPAPFLVAGASQINFQYVGSAGGGAMVVTVPTAVSPGFQIYVAGQ